MEIAIVTGIYPPTIGGAGAVMHSLAKYAPDRISVITCESMRKGNEYGTARDPSQHQNASTRCAGSHTL